MSLLIIRTGTILRIPTIEPLKVALAKKIPHTNASGLLIAWFCKVRVNKSLSGQLGEVFYGTQYQSEDLRKESLIMSKHYLQVE